MSALFQGLDTFDKALACWNVSKVENFGSMFEGAVKFNKVLKTWTPVNAKNMTNMFKNATLFNQQLCRWHWKTNGFPVAGVKSMFDLTACPFSKDPIEFRPIGNWTGITIPPFCQDCSKYQGAV
jgi:hypothetical protein